MPRIDEALRAARAYLPAGEARLLLGALLAQAPAWLIAHDDALLDAAQSRQFADWVARRARGEPIAYLIGRREFYGRLFEVAPSTLIPRPESELLVDRARTELGFGGTAPSAKETFGGTAPSAKETFGGTAPAGTRRHVAAPQVLDLGTGSGCIAISIALECPTARVTAVDVSTAALTIAARNVQRHDAPVTLLHSDWFAALHAQRFDLIVGNPPYIAEGDAHVRQGDLRFEPVSALCSGADGLLALRRIIAAAPAQLRTDGALWLEHGFDQANAVCALLRSAGFVDVDSQNDLAGHARISGGRWPG